MDGSAELETSITSRWLFFVLSLLLLVEKGCRYWGWGWSEGIVLPWVGWIYCGFTVDLLWIYCGFTVDLL
jgi:hypothetical protein